MPERPLHAGAPKLEMNAVTAGNIWQVGAVKLWAPSYVVAKTSGRTMTPKACHIAIRMIHITI